VLFVKGSPAYRLVEDKDAGRTLLQQGTWTPDLLDVIQCNNVQTLRLSFPNWQKENLDFLRTIPGLRGLDV